MGKVPLTVDTLLCSMYFISIFGTFSKKNGTFQKVGAKLGTVEGCQAHFFDFFVFFCDFFYFFWRTAEAAAETINR